MLLLLSLLLLLLLQSQMLLLRPLQGGRGGGADLDVHRSTRGGTDRRLQRDAAAGEAAIPWCPEAGLMSRHALGLASRLIAHVMSCRI